MEACNDDHLHYNGSILNTHTRDKSLLSRQNKTITCHKQDFNLQKNQNHEKFHKLRNKLPLKWGEKKNLVLNEELVLQVSAANVI